MGRQEVRGRELEAWKYNLCKFKVSYKFLANVQLSVAYPDTSHTFHPSIISPFHL